MTPRPLSVAIVSPSRDLLRRLSWLLSAFGYRTSASVELAEPMDLSNDGDIDVLLLDADAQELRADGASPLRRPRSPSIYTMLLCDPAQFRNIHDAVEWGVDDFLQKPINHGEVLSRLRAATRFLEFECRLQRQATRDPLTSLLTQSGLVAVMKRAGEAARSGPTSYAVVTLDLDFFGRITRRIGRKRADGILRAVAEVVKRSIGSHGHVARIEEDCFAAMIRCGQADQGRELAETLRERIATIELADDDLTTGITASLAYTAFDPLQDVAVEILDLATEALAHAKSSGRNCVVRVAEFDAPFADWRKELNSGNPFASVTARDVMQPFGQLLQSASEFDAAVPRLLASALDFFPIVDKGRSLVGLIGRDQVAQSRVSADQPVATATMPPVQPAERVAEDAPFGEIVERFTAEDLAFLVVVRNNEPRGYISRDSFLNLIEPITTGSFQANRPFSQRADYLVVPEVATSEKAGI